MMIRMLTIAVCSIASASAAAASLRATGNEPSWRLDIDAHEMRLLTNFGQTTLVAATPAAQVADGATRYVARTAEGDLVVTVVDRLCVDSMSGMPHPKSVTVVTGGQTLNGCGGDPASLLQGPAWNVVTVGGTPVVASSRATLAFGTDGRISGNASCNRFTGAYTLTGEGLSVSDLAGSRMMCDAPLMEQERRFLDALAGVRGFSIAADGTLLLQAGDGRDVEARRP